MIFIRHTLSHFSLFFAKGEWLLQLLLWITRGGILKTNMLFLLCANYKLKPSVATNIQPNTPKTNARLNPGCFPKQIRSNIAPTNENLVVSIKIVNISYNVMII